jgi:tRNA 2-thiouridine synthesizing protein A
VSNELQPVSQLDLRGLLCPMPVVKVSQGIKQIALGEAIEAYASDPGVLADIPAWCSATGNELIKMEKSDKGFRFLVRRLK